MYGIQDVENFIVDRHVSKSSNLTLWGKKKWAHFLYVKPNKILRNIMIISREGRDF